MSAEQYEHAPHHDEQLMPPDPEIPVVEEEDSGVAEPEPPAPPEETPAQAFERLANHRVTQARKFIRLLGNLSNKNQYAYTLEEASTCFVGVEEAMSEARNRFMDAAKPRGKDRDAFRLNG